MFSYIDNFRLPLARSDGILSGSTLDSCCLVGWIGPLRRRESLAARGWAYHRAHLSLSICALGGAGEVRIAR